MIQWISTMTEPPDVEQNLRENVIFPLNLKDFHFNQQGQLPTRSEKIAKSVMAKSNNCTMNWEG